MTGLPKVKIVGLTGMSGAGKSTVCEILKKSGFAVADCDVIARRTAENPAFLAELARRFPEKLTDESGKLDRRKTAERVFSDKRRNKLYCGIIFPYIINEVIRVIKSEKTDIIIDAPTLFEAGLDIICTDIVSVTAPAELCAERIILRDGISRELAEKRLDSQHNAEFFREKSDILIENTGSRSELISKAESAAARLKGK